MKMRTVLAAVIAAVTVSAVSVCGFAEAAGTDSGDAAASGTDSKNESAEPAPDAGETTGNPDTGVEGVAAVTGAIALAGAAVAISRKKD